MKHEFDHESYRESFPEVIPCIMNPTTHYMRRVGNYYICPTCTKIPEGFSPDHQLTPRDTPLKRTWFIAADRPLPLGVMCRNNMSHVHMRRLITLGCYTVWACPECEPNIKEPPQELNYKLETTPIITYDREATIEELSQAFQSWNWGDKYKK